MRVISSSYKFILCSCSQDKKNNGPARLSGMKIFWEMRGLYPCNDWVRTSQLSAFYSANLCVPSTQSGSKPNAHGTIYPDVMR
jgi:hypothetical protein